ncbi:MAG: SHOCT domain-containing protein [Smithellaceae bacterium]|jgi:putative membrane protein
MNKIYLFVVLTLVPFLTMCSGPYGHMMGGWDRTGNYECSFGFGYGGMFMWILFLIVLGVAIYFIVQNVKLKNGTGQTTESPIDILKKRYAKGEITKEEFDRMKKELQ